MLVIFTACLMDQEPMPLNKYFISLTLDQTESGYSNYLKRIMAMILNVTWMSVDMTILLHITTTQVTAHLHPSIIQATATSLIQVLLIILHKVDFTQIHQTHLLWYLIHPIHPIIPATTTIQAISLALHIHMNPHHTVHTVHMISHISQSLVRVINLQLVLSICMDQSLET